MMGVQDIEGVAALKGFESVKALHESTYQDCSTVIVTPTRGLLSPRWVQAWSALIAPLNQKRALRLVEGAEVADAYNKAIQSILSDWQTCKYRYVLTLEDDNLPPADAHLRLLASIGEYDAVGGLYFRKQEPHVGLLLGDPEHFRRTGEMEFRPRDPRAAIDRGDVVEVNCVPMGCTLFKLDLFRSTPGPWFQTVNEFLMTPEGPLGQRRLTQDAAFCEAMRWRGKRFAVDCGLRVGHLDIETGEVW
jgi:hypothetical protein